MEEVQQALIVPAPDAEAAEAPQIQGDTQTQKGKDADSEKAKILEQQGVREVVGSLVEHVRNLKSLVMGCLRFQANQYSIIRVFRVQFRSIQPLKVEAQAKLESSMCAGSAGSHRSSSRCRSCRSSTDPGRRADAEGQRRRLREGQDFGAAGSQGGSR